MRIRNVLLITCDGHTPFKLRTRIQGSLARIHQGFMVIQVLLAHNGVIDYLEEMTWK